MVLLPSNLAFIDLKNTNLLYLADQGLLETEALIIGLLDTEDDSKAFILDSTIFYPQGGGQPFDQGLITINDQVFNVTAVKFSEGLVYHFVEESLSQDLISQVAVLSVNVERRQLNSKLHTAGHLLDVAMSNAGVSFPPTKGYHFPDGPYVEYEGMIEPEDRKALLEKVEFEANQLIKRGSKVADLIVESYDELHQHCNFVPAYVPKDKPIRVVKVANVGCPCGGTHIEDIADLGSLSVHKIKVKSGKIRVSYRLG
ncbi:MAG TPA: hypothetical protein EYN89_03785 [Flavobacteriales bacterium]|nr:hypothetical protein [Flavobacteriales bacterium]